VSVLRCGCELRRKSAGVETHRKHVSVSLKTLISSAYLLGSGVRATAESTDSSASWLVASRSRSTWLYKYPSNVFPFHCTAVGHCSTAMSVSVCFCVCPRATTRLTPISVLLTYGCGPALLWLRCDTLCTSGYMIWWPGIGDARKAYIQSDSTGAGGFNRATNT